VFSLKPESVFSLFQNRCSDWSRMGVQVEPEYAGEVDLASELYGQVFEPLKDKEFFKSFELEGHTLSWVNGADFAPEFLYEQIASNSTFQRSFAR